MVFLGKDVILMSWRKRCVTLRPERYASFALTLWDVVKAIGSKTLWATKFRNTQQTCWR